jgi:hypothetical protein
MRETADGQPVFVLLAEVHHSINTLRQNFFWPALSPIDHVAAAADKWPVRVRWLRVQ